MSITPCKHCQFTNDPFSFLTTDTYYTQDRNNSCYTVNTYTMKVECHCFNSLHGFYIKIISLPFIPNVYIWSWLDKALTCSVSSQVRSLSSYLEMEGYDRLPFSTLQLESFHRQVKQRLEQENQTASQVMVRNAHFGYWKQLNKSQRAVYSILFCRYDLDFYQCQERRSVKSPQ